MLVDMLSEVSRQVTCRENVIQQRSPACHLRDMTNMSAGRLYAAAAAADDDDANIIPAYWADVGTDSGQYVIDGADSATCYSDYYDDNYQVVTCQISIPLGCSG